MTQDIRQTVLDRCSYGLYVVTSHAGGKLNGQISDALMQVTAFPPRVAVSINKTELTHEMIMQSRVFSASILAQSADLPFIGIFGFKSGREIDKLSQVNHRIGQTGCPLVLDHTAALFEATVRDTVDLDSHTVFVGDIVSAELLQENAPILTYRYYTTNLKGKVPKNAPSYHEGESSGTAAGGASSGKHVCQVCGYVYDPAKGDPAAGVAPGTPFDALPEHWVCPICGVGTDQFAPVADAAPAPGRYVCNVCGWIYDPAKGDPNSGTSPGTAFADLAEDWVCPICGMGKDVFALMG